VDGAVSQCLEAGLVRAKKHNLKILTKNVALYSNACIYVYGLPVIDYVWCGDFRTFLRREFVTVQPGVAERCSKYATFKPTSFFQVRYL